VGEQHTSNRAHALVCDQCFRYLGPLELQLGYRLLQCHVLQTPVDPGSPSGIGNENASPSSPEHLSESIKLTALAMLRREVRVPDVPWQPQNECASACNGGHVPLHLQQLLAQVTGAQRGEVRKPPIKTTPENYLGRAILLPDASDYLFCNHDCAAIAWVTWAALLSPGPRGQLQEAVRSSVFVENFDPQQLSQTVWDVCTMHGRLSTFSGPGTHSPQEAASQLEQDSTESYMRPAWLPALRDARAVHAFYEHADNSNDIFRVAARAIAIVACSFFMRMALHGCADADAAGARLNGEQASPEANKHLMQAWTPFQAACKAVWWEHVPMPQDLSDEAAWRSDLKCANPTPSTCCR
jgi:hypothetical protein